MDGDLAGRARRVLAEHWRAPGFTVPSAERYPWQWLWDSCFHAVAWAALGEGDRAVSELRVLLASATPDGFVPHVVYHDGSSVHASFWRWPGRSTLTQPPVIGLAVEELGRWGVDVPGDVREGAERSLRWLLRERRRAEHDGLLVVCHPWETGCDDSARWDPWRGTSSWYDVKGSLVASLVLDASGASVANPAFEVAAAGFNALAAASLRALGCHDEAQELAEAVDARWSSELRTWGDGGGSAVRTLDGLLPLLVSGRPDAVEAVAADLVDARAYGGRCGPAGVHRAEPTYDPSTYWRGPAWPPLTWLLARASRDRGLGSLAGELGGALRTGAEASGFAEYWHPDSGEGLGAAPQSWAALAVALPA